jgi:hypothetical protein
MIAFDHSTLKLRRKVKVENEIEGRNKKKRGIEECG